MINHLLPREIFQKREELGLKNSINLLIEIIEKDVEKDNSKRKSAIKYLGLISNHSNILKNECFNILENILISDDDIELKCEAANSLAFTGLEKALKPLKWLLEQESTNNQVKISVLKAIANIKFLEPEIKLFIKELDSNYQSIKECIIHQLRKLKPEILIKNLLESLKNTKISERHKIEIIKLISFSLEITNASFKDSSSFKITYSQILSNLMQYKFLLLESIITVLKDDLLESAVTILRLLGHEIHDDLIEYVNITDFILKKNAIQLIGKLRINKAVKSLLKNLDSIYDEINKAAIKSLGEIGVLSVVPDLFNILNIEDVNFEYIDLDMKWYVLDALKEIYLKNKKASFDYLYSILNSKNDVLLENVAYLLGEIGYKRFANPLTNLLNRRNLDVRKNASIALGKIGKLDSIDPLIKIVEDKNNYWLLRKVAIDAVHSIYLKNFYKKSKSSKMERFFVISSQKLIDHLNNNLDENFKVKLSIIKFLEMFGDKTAVNALMKQTNDFYRLVRIASSKAIKKIEKRCELGDNSN